MSSLSMQMQNVKLSKGDVVGKWRVKFSIGSGAFGAVYLVERVNAKDGVNKYAAMKVEPRMPDVEDEVLRMDVYVLSKVQYHDKFCTIYDFAANDKLSYVVMTLIGPKSLDDLRREQPGRMFGRKTTLRIGIQIIDALFHLHKAGFIHRDLKPANMAPGYKRKNIVYLFDFGLARYIYEDEQKTKLRKSRSKVSFRGTYRYCSLNAHKNGDQGRVDDIWGALYSLIELCSGKLPWSGVHPMESCKLKETTPDSQLFEGCPQSFRVIKKELSKLRFEDEPDYKNYQLLMYNDLTILGGTLQKPFVWEKVDERNKDDGGNRNEPVDSKALRGLGDTDTLRNVDYRSATKATSEVHGMLFEDDDVMGDEDTLQSVPGDVLERKKPAAKQKQELKAPRVDNRTDASPSTEKPGKDTRKAPRVDNRTGSSPSTEKPSKGIRKAPRVDNRTGSSPSTEKPSKGKGASKGPKKR